MYRIIRRSFSAAAPNEGYIKRLVSVGISEAESKAIVEQLEQIADEQARCLSNSFLIKPEYEKSFSYYHSNMIKFKELSDLTEKLHFDSCQNDYSALAIEMGKVEAAVKEEGKKVESGIQLDINLEKKRAKEGLLMLEDKSKDSNEYQGNKIGIIQKDLNDLGKHAGVAIGGILLVNGSFCGNNDFWIHCLLRSLLNSCKINTLVHF